jgi:hypothetical protein
VEQELPRHATVKMTLKVYTPAVTLYVTPVIYLYLHRLRRIRSQKANDSEAVPSTEALGVS